MHVVRGVNVAYVTCAEGAGPGRWAAPGAGQAGSVAASHAPSIVSAELALYPVVRHWTPRVLVAAYPVATTLVVVATGNHLFLDALAGAMLAVVTWAGVTRTGIWLAARRMRAR